MMKVSFKILSFFMSVVYFFTGQLLIPKTAYNGQKFIKLVANKTPPTINKIIPSVPVITLVKNKIDTITANNILTILSMFPKFFFMTYTFKMRYNSSLVYVLKK
ncbi:hypothetical protein JCM19298_2901 [Nonlabens ulvanivorans]|nr:hypothetical protein JCM19298_2901 [Nonlabens ulvanivorans]